jgi:PAS domain-containing protein
MEGLCSLDQTGAITLCNASFLRMTGFQRREEVIGKDFHAAFATDWDGCGQSGSSWS